MTSTTQSAGRFVCLLTVLLCIGCGEKPIPTSVPVTSNPVGPEPVDSTAEPVASAPTPPNSSPTSPVPSEPPPKKVGGCTTQDKPGTATITTVTNPPPDSSVCPKPKKSKMVAFSFTPAGASAPSHTNQLLLIGDGKALPETCLAPLGIKVGATFPTTLKEITAGACLDGFAWPDTFLTPCESTCF